MILTDSVPERLTVGFQLKAESDRETRDISGRASGDPVDIRVRATLGLRRFDGDSRIVHDHESVPAEPSLAS